MIVLFALTLLASIKGIEPYGRIVGNAYSITEERWGGWAAWCLFAVLTVSYLAPTVIAMELCLNSL